ncbi:MAG: hypothetical protein KF711_15870 [Nitrospira sp.]|nr:hypothetical protein [Nitrospira sp.]
MHERMDTFSFTVGRKFWRRVSCALLAVGMAVIIVSCSWVGVGSVSPSIGEADFSAELISPQRIYYNIDLRRNRKIADAIRQGLGKGASQSEAVYISEPPAHGLFCEISLDRQPRKAALSNLWMIASVLSLGVLPFYDDEGERIDVRYDLYVDRQFKGSYTYVVSRRGLYWAGAPLIKPFLSSSWSESILDDQVWNSAFRTTARQFLMAIIKDGVQVLP